jgi:hypothetical protein
VNVLIVLITIFSGIAAIGAVVNIVILINSRRESRIKERTSDEETEPIDEQYRRMYSDTQETS